MVNALPPVEGEHALGAGTHFGNIGLAKSLKKNKKTKTLDIRHTGIVAKLTACD